MNEMAMIIQNGDDTCGGISDQDRFGLGNGDDNGDDNSGKLSSPFRKMAMIQLSSPLPVRNHS